jgi:hypothetical protein
MAEKKGSGDSLKINNTEWGMAIGALLLIDCLELGLDLLFGIGVFANPFIDILVNLLWPTYLHLRGVNLKSTKMLATLFTGGLLQFIPGFDGFWAIEGFVVMLTSKTEEKIKEKTGIDVEKIAAKAEGATGSPESASAEASAETETEKSEEPNKTSGSESPHTKNEPTDATDEESENRDNEESGNASEKVEGEEKSETPEEEVDKKSGGEDERKTGGENINGGKNKSTARNIGSIFGTRGNNQPKGLFGTDVDRSVSTSNSDEDETKNNEPSQFRSNLLDLSLSYGERKKQRKKEDEESFDA